MELQLSVCVAGKDYLDINIAKDATVKTLKDVILSQADYFKCVNGARKEVDIIITFAGDVLTDESILKDVCLRNFTVLHAVPYQKAAVVLTEDSCCDAEEMFVSDLIPVEKAKVFHCVFYGYCKDVCDALVPALLRFSCSQCGSTNVIAQTGSVSEDWDKLCANQFSVPARCLAECGKTSATMFFKCAAHPSRKKIDDKIVYLRQIVLNQDNAACVTCEAVGSPVVDFLCDPNHIMCLECFIQYCSVLVSDRKLYWEPGSGCVVPCPVGCPCGFVRDPHHLYLLGRKLYEKYKDFAAEERFVREGGIYCAERSCNTAFVDLADSGYASCPKGHRYCRICRDKVHAGSCNRPVTWTEELSALVGQDPGKVDIRSRITIANTTKSCPGCHTPVERNGGCMHITCARCGKEFCWMCLTSWNIDCMSRHWFAA